MERAAGGRVVALQVDERIADADVRERAVEATNPVRFRTEHANVKVEHLLVIFCADDYVVKALEREGRLGLRRRRQAVAPGFDLGRLCLLGVDLCRREVVEHCAAEGHIGRAQGW